jgi:hypothetical protein
MTIRTYSPSTTEVSHVARHAAWFAGGSCAAFLMPYVGVSVLDLHHDVYYGLYFAATLAMLAAYVRWEHVDVRALFARNWIWSAAIGGLTAVAVARNVVVNSDPTPRPHGPYFVFELLWRGVGYGTIDALLLTAFPCAVAYGMLRGHTRGVVGRVRFVALTLPMILLITATYHLGYPQFREDGVGQPEVGNTLISVPALLTTNPAGSVVAHAAMHTTAVMHSYETDVYLPPQTSVTSR